MKEDRHTVDDGLAVFDSHLINAPIANIAHSQYHAEVISSFSGELTQVLIHKAVQGGSSIYAEAGEHWPTLKAWIQPVHDDQRRTYMHVRRAVVDHGKAHVKIAPRQESYSHPKPPEMAPHLTSTVAVRFAKLIGQTYLDGQKVRLNGARRLMGNFRPIPSEVSLASLPCLENQSRILSTKNV